MTQPATQLAKSAMPAALPNLTAAQQAYTLETGDTIVVETTQRAPAVNPARAGTENFVIIQVRAWKVAADGTPAKDANGKPLEIPAKVHAILHSALAEGAVNLETVLADATSSAVARARTWLNVKTQIEQIPLSQ